MSTDHQTRTTDIIRQKMRWISALRAKTRESSLWPRAAQLTCGTVANVIDCLDGLTTVAESADSAPDIQFCAVNTVRVIGEGGDCVITFAGHDSETTCISNKKLSGEAQKVFFECINPPSGNTGSRGCVDWGDTGHICIRNVNAGECS